MLSNDYHEISLQDQLGGQTQYSKTGCIQSLRVLKVLCSIFNIVFLVEYGFLLEKAMAPHSSTLAWKIPWTEEPGRLQFMRSLRVGHD